MARAAGHWGRLAAYYSLLLIITLAGLAYGYYFSEVFFVSHRSAG